MWTDHGMVLPLYQPLPEVPDAETCASLFLQRTMVLLAVVGSVLLEVAAFAFDAAVASSLVSLSCFEGGSHADYPLVCLVSFITCRLVRRNVFSFIFNGTAAAMLSKSQLVFGSVAEHVRKHADPTRPAGEPPGRAGGRAGAFQRAHGGRGGGGAHRERQNGAGGGGGAGRQGPGGGGGNNANGGGEQGAGGADDRPARAEKPKPIALHFAHERDAELLQAVVCELRSKWDRNTISTADAVKILMLERVAGTIKPAEGQAVGDDGDEHNDGDDDFAEQVAAQASKYSQRWLELHRKSPALRGVNEKALGKAWKAWKGDQAKFISKREGVGKQRLHYFNEQKKDWGTLPAELFDLKEVTALVEQWDEHDGAAVPKTRRRRSVLANLPQAEILAAHAEFDRSPESDAVKLVLALDPHALKKKATSQEPYDPEAVLLMEAGALVELLYRVQTHSRFCNGTLRVRRIVRSLGDARVTLQCSHNRTCPHKPYRHDHGTPVPFSGKCKLKDSKGQEFVFDRLPVKMMASMLTHGILESQARGALSSMDLTLTEAQSTTIAANIWDMVTIVGEERLNFVREG